MIETVAGFGWDEGNRAKCARHGVSIQDIEAAFATGPRIAPDLRHSESEARYIAIGPALSGRLIFVAFTLRTRGHERLIRPISARFMHQKEIDRYAAQSPDDDLGRRGRGVP
ncbi:MAG: BrnT family toxin [Phenylobacterium sp.]